MINKTNIFGIILMIIGGLGVVGPIAYIGFSTNPLVASVVFGALIFIIGLACFLDGKPENYLR